MQYREPINVSDIVRELRRLWVLPLVVGLAMGLLFAALQSRADDSYEQRIDVVGSDVHAFADAIGAPDVVEKFDADVVGRREQSKLEVVGRQSGSTKVRVQGSAQTNTVSVFGTAPNPQAAVDSATDYADQIITFQRSSASQRIAATREQLERDRARIETELDAATGNESDRVLLLADRSSVIKQLFGLSALERGGGGGVHDLQVVGSPSAVRGSSLGTYAVLGVLLGLVLGCGAVVLKRTLSTAVYGEADLARYGSEVPVLADINGAGGTSKGVFAALAWACSQAATPGRVPGVLLAGVNANSVPDSLAAGVLEALPALDLEGSTLAASNLSRAESMPLGQFQVVVVDDGIRESSSAISCAGRLASTVVVVRRRKTSIASTLEAIDLVRQADGQLQGIVIVD